MKISGFTFVKNAVKFDYPIVESIRSILPICEEYIVLAGNSDDSTNELLRTIDSDKIKVFDSTWDETLRQGGRVLAMETDKAKDLVSSDSDWLFYLQADEVIHEKYLSEIQNSAEKYLNNKNVEGLLFKYRHFYGSYKYFADSRKWYRREIRLIRNDKAIKSHGDAQGFRKNDRKLNVKLIDAEIFHYGWVKSPYHQKQKERSFHKLWHDDNWLKQNIKNEDLFDYSNIDSLKLFNGIHPEVMKSRIEKEDWSFNANIKEKNINLSNRILYYLERSTGLRPFEYKNYKLID